MADIFRKSALERLSSPEQLDQLISVSTPKGWLALLTTTILLVMVVVWSFLGNIPSLTQGRGILLTHGGLHGVPAPVSGMIVDLSAREGDYVVEGATIARIQPTVGGARTDVLSPRSGIVAFVSAQTGTFIQAGTEILEFASKSETLEGILLVPVDQGKKIRLGMEVHIIPSTVNEQIYGYMLGSVTHVDTYPSNTLQLRNILGSDEMVKSFQQGGEDVYAAAPIRVVVALERDPGTISGFRWSSRKGPPFHLTTNTVFRAEAATETSRPIDLVIPYLREKLGAKNTL